MKTRDWERRLIEAKVLLAFGAQICAIQHENNGGFIFEHPLHAGAEDSLRDIGQRDGVNSETCSC